MIRPIVRTLLLVTPFAALACARLSSNPPENGADVRVASAARPAPAAAAPAPAKLAHASARPVTAPTTHDVKAKDFAGVHNVVAFAPGYFSGSAPEGSEGFESLAALGVRTILSVDGAVPDVDEARRHGLRYVHLPISYGGMSEERKLAIAKACKELPGPIYVHCHHGKHRSAGAVAAAVVTLGLATPDEAIARMKVSGTAASYTGLYRCAAEATPVATDVLAALPAEFPERSIPSGVTASMTHIDESNDELEEVEKAGWKAPDDHADLAPASIAGRMADLFRTGAEHESSTARSQEFVEWMKRASVELESLERGITSGSAPEELSRRMQVVQQSCKSCHAKYRD